MLGGRVDSRKEAAGGAAEETAFVDGWEKKLLVELVEVNVQ